MIELQRNKNRERIPNENVISMQCRLEINMRRKKKYYFHTGLINESVNS